MLYQRKFEDYETYKELQCSKAKDSLDCLLAKSPKRIAGFSKLFKAVKPYFSEGNMLCLGARTGCEVIAAEQAGFSGSIGIDLHPIGKDVIESDWAKMPFTDSYFDNIFTNSLDHVVDLHVLIAEINRVLKPNGTVLLMIPYFSKGKTGPHTLSNWLAVAPKEGLYWDIPSDVVDAFILAGFILTHSFVKGKWHSFFLKKEK